jgi:hypothetical protein
MSSSNEEFERRIRDFGITEWYVHSTVVSGSLLAVLSIAMIASGQNTGVAVVLLIISVALATLAVSALRRIKHIE